MESEEKTGFFDPMSLARTVFNSFSWIYLFDINGYYAANKL